MTIQDPFGSRLRLFLSADIVGSTAFKQATDRRSKDDADREKLPAQPWFSPIAQFYKGMEQAVAREWKFAEERSRRIGWPPGDAPEFWKSIGDEVLYTKLLSDHRQALTMLHAWMRAVASYRSQIRQKFPTLDLKSTAWIAGFPVHNAEVFFGSPSSSLTLDENDEDPLYSNLSLMNRYYADEPQTRISRDFIGPAIDTGFRLAHLSSSRRLVISVELALILIHAARTQPNDENYPYEKLRFYFDGRHTFKGVFGGLPYPVFWIDMRPSPILEETEDKLHKILPLETDHVSEFCTAFIKESTYCFTPYISENLEPVFSRLPEDHETRLKELRGYWEHERTKREVERKSLAQTADDTEAAGASSATENFNSWIATNLPKP